MKGRGKALPGLFELLFEFLQLLLNALAIKTYRIRSRRAKFPVKTPSTIITVYDTINGVMIPIWFRAIEISILDTINRFMISFSSKRRLYRI